jgi:superfamily II RNA helicase
MWEQIIVASPDSVRLILLSAILPNDANLAA